MDTIAIAFALAWKSLFVGGVTLLLLGWARRRSAAERSWIAHAGLATLLLLPVAMLVLPGWNPLPAETTVSRVFAAAAPNAITVPGEAAAKIAGAPVAAQSAIDLPSLLVGAYAVPALLLLLATLVAVARLFAMRSRAEVLVDAPWLTALARAQARMGFKHGTALLVSTEINSPISWGLLRPTIVLDPRAADATREAEAIIAHELAHVARWDWAKLLLARTACALFWFNPFVWKLARDSHQLREEAADDAVLAHQIDGVDYAELLVGAARHENRSMLLAAHGVAPAPGSLKRRVARVLDGALARRPASLGWAAAVLVTAGVLAAPIAALDFAKRSSTLLTAPVLAGTKARADRIDPADSPLTRAPQDEAWADSAAKPGGKLTAEQIVEMRAVGATPEYVAALRETGIGDLDPDAIVALRALGVDAAYIADIRRAFPNVDGEEIAQLRALGVNGTSIRAMRAEVRDLNVDGMTQLAAMGVDPTEVRAMRRKGVNTETADAVVEYVALHGGGRDRYITDPIPTIGRPGLPPVSPQDPADPADPEPAAAPRN